MGVRGQRLPVARLWGQIGEIAEIFRPPQRRLGHETVGLPGVPAFAKCYFLGPRLYQIGNAVQYRAAFRPVHRRPSRKRRLRRLCCRVNIRSPPQRHAGDQAFIHRRPRFKPPARPRQRLPVDQVQNPCFAEPRQMAVQQPQMCGKIRHRILLGPITCFVK